MICVKISVDLYDVRQRLYHDMLGSEADVNEKYKLMFRDCRVIGDKTVGSSYSVLLARANYVMSQTR